MDRAVFCLFMLATAAGCAPLLPSTARHVTARSPLRPATPSSDSVSLEIIFARLPELEAGWDERLWNWVDEQHIPIETRRQLTSNGFRAGVIGGNLPEELTEALQLADAYEMKQQAVRQDDPLAQGVQLDEEPLVQHRLLQLRMGNRGEILASPAYEELPLLKREGEHVCGRSYRQAQCLFSLVPDLAPDGRLLVQLTPEVQHGEPQREWSGSEGIFRLTMSRPKEVLDELRVSSLLAPGEMLLVGSLPSRPGSLGHYFFTEKSGGALQHKLLLIRLAGRPPQAE